MYCKNSTIESQVALDEIRSTAKRVIAEQNAKYNAGLLEKAKKMSNRELLEAVYIKFYAV